MTMGIEYSIFDGKCLDTCGIKLLSQWQYTPREYLRFFDQLPSIDYWIDEINTVIRSDDSFLIQAKDSNGSLLAFLVFQYLPWESKLYSKTMGTFSHVVFDKDTSSIEGALVGLFRKAIVIAETKQYGFISVKTPTQDMPAIHALEQLGFLLVDINQYYVVNIEDSNSYVVNDGILIEQAEEDDLDAAMEMFESSFADHFGRFNSDTVLKDSNVNFYKEWARSSFLGYADLIIAAKIDGNIAGLSIWKNASEMEIKHNLPLAHYSIGAVAANHFGKGIFQRVTLAGMKVMQERGFQFIEGPTHINNYPVQRGYQKLNWINTGAKASFHLWI